MRNPRKYFEEHGFIFGISACLSFENSYLIFFDDIEKALQWERTGKYDEPNRKLVTEKQASAWRKKYID